MVAIAPPTGHPNHRLRIELEAVGLVPVVEEGGLSAVFVDDAGDLTLRYVGVLAWDANHREVQARLVATARGLAVEFAVERDDAPKGRLGVSMKRQVIGRHKVGADGHAAGVSVLHNNAGRVFKGFDTLQRSIGVGHIVVRERLSL